MKFFTNKQFDEYTAKLIESNYKEGLADGLERGYENGRHAGLMADKKGVLMSGRGLYVFENGVAVEASESK